MDKATITKTLKAEAQQLGFELAGACPGITPAGFTHFHDWLNRGFGGEMTYLHERRNAYADPTLVLPGVRSLLMLAMPYRTAEPSMPGVGQGRVSRYAWGPADYHDVIHDRLTHLAAKLRELAPTCHVRGVVDTAPLLEREFAQLAGLGWVGKNTMLLNKYQGSWFFLAALLTDEELQYDMPHQSDHCGTCRLCLDACPTQAFPEPYVLDATRCISYLTIELRDQIPRPLRKGVGNWLFGCDICNEVCPWNHRAPAGDDEQFGPEDDLNPISLAELFELDEQGFRQRFRHSPLWRPRRRGLLRNAAIVLGNQGALAAVAPLSHGLNDDDDIVRGACAWALGQIGSETARAALAQRLTVELEDEVRQEIQSALAESPPGKAP